MARTPRASHDVFQLRDAAPKEQGGALDGGAAAREFRYGWITPRQAMAHLGIGSLTALYRLIDQHQLPFGRVGRLYRFRRDHLDQWVERRGVAALSAVKAS